MDTIAEKIDVARQVMLILGADPMTVKSWGFNSPVDIPNGLEFKVRGFKFRGKVRVTYDVEKDSFDVSFISKEDVVKTIPDVVFTSLIESVDRVVETA